MILKGAKIGSILSTHENKMTRISHSSYGFNEKLLTKLNSLKIKGFDNSDTILVINESTTAMFPQNKSFPKNVTYYIGQVKYNNTINNQFLTLNCVNISDFKNKSCFLPIKKEHQLNLDSKFVLTDKVNSAIALHLLYNSNFGIIPFLKSSNSKIIQEVQSFQEKLFAFKYNNSGLIKNNNMINTLLDLNTILNKFNNLCEESTIISTKNSDIILQVYKWNYLEFKNIFRDENNLIHQDFINLINNLDEEFTQFNSSSDSITVRFSHGQDITNFDNLC